MIADFVRYLEAERRYSPLTVRNYRHDVEQFLAWLGVDDARFEPQRITTDDIREWILYRTETGRVSAASMNREISSLRALFRWLLRTGAVAATSCIRSPRCGLRSGCRPSSPKAA